MSVIRSDSLRAEINEKGSTLESFFDALDNKELLWQGDGESWTGKDVTIFPFVARLKDGYYTVDGQRYEMPSHGLCKEHVFEIAKSGENFVEHKFVWDSETLKRYPYKFDLRVIHSVDGDKYSKTMRVKNLGESDMYFALGGHPAIALTSKGDCDTSDNFIRFDRLMRPKNYYLDEKGHFIERLGDFPPFEILRCDKELMKKYATLIFADEDFQRLEVVRGDGATLEFGLNSPPVLAFWSHPQKGEYICVEPWWGIPDNAQPIREIKDKERINALGSGKEFEYTFSIKIKRR